MDPPVCTACVFFPKTTYGSTSVHCMCVLFHKPHMDPLESLHVCSFHKPHMGPLESLYVCSYTKTSTRVIARVFFPQTTYGSTSVTACVFFPQTTYGSTSVPCMCVLFQKPNMDPPVVIARLFISTNHLWIH